MFYHKQRYLAFLEELLDAEDHTLVVEQDGRITGALPLLAAEHQGRRVYNSLPFFGSNGGILSDNTEAHAALVTAYQDLLQDDATAAATVIQNPLDPDSTRGLPSNHHDERIGLFTRLDAAQGEEELLQRMAPRTRRAVRKAQQSGLTVARRPEAMADLERIHVDNMAAIGGTAKTPAFFEGFDRHFRAGVDHDLWIASHDDQVVSALLVAYHGRVAEYLIPATDHDHRNAQPLSLILIAALRHAAQRGCTWWNWGGTWRSQEGVYRFKSQWDPVRRPYRYAVQVNDPTLYESSPDQILTRYPGFFVLPWKALHVTAV